MANHREITGQVYDINGKILTDGQVIFRLTTIIPKDMRSRRQKKDIPDSEIIADINPDGSIHARLMVPPVGGWDYSVHLPDGSSFEFSLSAAVTVEEAPILLADLRSLTNLKMVGPIKRYIDSIMIEDEGADVRAFSSVHEMLVANPPIRVTQLTYVSSDTDSKNDGLYIAKVNSPSSIGDFQYVNENAIRANSIRTYKTEGDAIKDWAVLEVGDVVWVVNPANPTDDGPRVVLVDYPTTVRDLARPITSSDRADHLRMYSSHADMLADAPNMLENDMSWVHDGSDSSMDGAWMALIDAPDTRNLVRVPSSGRESSLKTFPSVADLFAAGVSNVRTGDLVWVKGDAVADNDGPYVALLNNPTDIAGYVKLNVGAAHVRPRAVSGYAVLAGLDVKNKEIVIVNDPINPLMNGVYVATKDNPTTASDYARISHSTPHSVHAYGTQASMLADAVHFKAGDVYWVSGDANVKKNGVYIVKINAPQSILVDYSHIKLTAPVHAKVFDTVAEMIAGGSGLVTGQTVLVTKDADVTKNGEYVAVNDNPDKFADFVRFAYGSHHHPIDDVDKLQAELDSLKASIFTKLDATSAAISLHVYKTKSDMLVGGASLTIGDVAGVISGPILKGTGISSISTNMRLYVANTDKPAAIGDYNRITISIDSLPDLEISNISGLTSILTIAHNSLRTFTSKADLVANSSELYAGDLVWMKDSSSPVNDGPYIARMDSPSTIADFVHISMDAHSLQSYSSLSDMLAAGTSIRHGGIIWVAGDATATNDGAYLAKMDKPVKVTDFTKLKFGEGNLKSDGTVQMDIAYAPINDEDIATKLYVDDATLDKISSDDIGVPDGIASLDIDMHIPEPNFPDYLSRVELDLKQPVDEKDIAGGYVGLDANSKIDTAYLPAAWAIPREIFTTRPLMLAGSTALIEGDLALVHGDPVVAHNGEYVVIKNNPTVVGDFLHLSSTIVKHSHKASEVNIRYSGRTQGLQYLVDNFLSEGTPIGTIMMWPVTGVPAGCLVCDGSTFKAIDYPELFGVLGGNTLPDLRNSFIRGAGTARTPLSTEAGATAAPTTPFDSTFTGSHKHTTSRDGGHAHAMQAVAQDYDTSHRAGSRPSIAAERHEYTKIDAYTTMYRNDPPALHEHNINRDGLHQHHISAGGDTETRPANIALVYVIKARANKVKAKGVAPIRYEGIGVAGGLSVIHLDEQANKDLLVVVDGLVLPESSYIVTGLEVALNTPITQANTYTVINYAAGVGDPHHIYATQALMLADVYVIKLGELCFVHGDPDAVNNGEYICIVDNPRVITDFEHLGSYVRIHTHTTNDVVGLKDALKKGPYRIRTFSSLAVLFASRERDEFKPNDVVWVDNSANENESGPYLVLNGVPRTPSDVSKLQTGGTAIRTYLTKYAMIADGKNLRNGDFMWVHGGIAGDNGPYIAQISNTLRKRPTDSTDFVKISLGTGTGTGAGAGGPAIPGGDPGGLTPIEIPDLPINKIITLSPKLMGKQDKSEKGKSNGYASLDSSGLVPKSQLPSSIPDGIMVYKTASAMTASGTKQVKDELLWVYGTTLAENGPYIPSINSPTDITDYLKIPMVMLDAAGKVPVSALPSSTAVPHHIFTTQALMLAGGAAISQGEMVLVTADADAAKKGEYVALQSAPTLITHYDHLSGAIRAHKHAIADVTGLQAALGGKIPIGFVPVGIYTYDTASDMVSDAAAQGDKRLLWVNGPNAAENGPYMANAATPTSIADYAKIALGSSVAGIADVPGLQTGLDSKLSKDGSVEVDTAFTPASDRHIVYKKYVDDAVAGVSAGVPAGSETTANKGIASGYAGLDATSKVPVANLPDRTIAQVTGLQTAIDAKETTANKGVASGYAPLDASSEVPAANLPDRAQADITGLVTALTAKQEISEKGVADGYAGLDATGKVPPAQLPPVATRPHHIFTTQALMLAGGAPIVAGEMVLVTADPSTNNNGEYVAKQDAPTLIAHYDQIGGVTVRTHNHIVGDITGLQTAIDAKEATANKGAASGYAGLDAGSKVPVANLPDRTIAQVTGLQTAIDAKEATANKGVASGYAGLDAASKVPVANLPDRTIAQVTGLQTAIDAKGDLKADGTVEIAGAFVPANDRHVVYKKYVDDAVAGVSAGIPTGAEITANKGTANGYAGLDASSEVPVANLPARTISDVTGLQAAIDAKEATANKGAASGYAPLDAGSRVPVANLPDRTIAQVTGLQTAINGQQSLMERGAVSGYAPLDVTAKVPSGNLPDHNDLAGVDAADSHPIAGITGLQTALDATEKSANKGVASGYVPLNSSSKIDATYLPPSTAIPHHLFATQALMLAGGAPIKAGEMVLVTADPNTDNNGEYVARQDAPTLVAHYDHLGGVTVRSHNHIVGDVTGLQTAIDAKQSVSEKGTASGYAGLDATSKVPVANLPDRTIAQVTGLQTAIDAKEVAANKGVASGYAPLDASSEVPVANLPDRAQVDITGLAASLVAKQDTSEKGSASGYAGLDATSKVPVANLPDRTIAQVTGLQVAIDATEKTAMKGVANGYAPLGGGSKVPVANLPNRAISAVTGLQVALDAKEATVNKGAADGYAPLDAASKVPAVNLPDHNDLAGRGAVDSHPLAAVTGLQPALDKKIDKPTLPVSEGVALFYVHLFDRDKYAMLCIPDALNDGNPHYVTIALAPGVTQADIHNAASGTSGNMYSALISTRDTSQKYKGIKGLGYNDLELIMVAGTLIKFSANAAAPPIITIDATGTAESGNLSETYLKRDGTVTIEPAFIPSTDSDIVNKKYVDNAVSSPRKRVFTSSGTLVINGNIGDIFNVTVRNNATISFASPLRDGVITLIITQDRTGNRVITWDNSIKWSGGTPPVLNTLPNSVSIYTFTSVSGGHGSNTWYGVVTGTNFS